ncbi:AHH domain-containing protein, partial [Vibrio vulnificus]|uniref:AHH domain-containing protein n=1 Tax=Vibrio vulnificus TaxID=672 RepID=UPI00117EC851
FLTLYLIVFFTAILVKVKVGKIVECPFYLRKGIIVKSSIDKDSQYRTRLLNAIGEEHPIYHGIDMQAHHIISRKGVELSGLGWKLEALTYHINNIENLVFIPCTLAGACHLGVQLHRGDHTYHDDEHPRCYHVEVSDRIKRLEETMDKRCEKGKPIQSLIDKESVKILKAIDNFEIPLTSIFRTFKPETVNTIGCGNAKTIKTHSKEKCKASRIHFDKVPKQNYTLRVGQ